MSVEFGAVTSVIKAADVIMGPPVMVGIGSPILQQAEAVASAAWSKSEVPKAFHTALADVNLDPGIQPSVPKADIVDQANQVTERAWNTPPLSWWWIPTIAVMYNFPSVQPQAVPTEPIPTRVESQQPTYIQTDQAMATSVLNLPQQAEAVIEEKEIKEKQADQNKIRVSEQQHLEEAKLLNVEDWQVAEQRRFEISQAIKKAWVTIKESKIFGWMVVRFLPAEHQGSRSQIIKKTGPDGSLVDTKQAIRTDPRQFLSEQEATAGLLPYVSIYKPVKKAQHGKRVDIHDVVRVLRYLTFKPMLVYEVMVQRVTKKKIYYKNSNIQDEGETKIKAETSLEDYPQLAAVFRVDRLNGIG